MTCTICDQKCGKWKHRYRGEIYCRDCFRDHFELLECTKCRKKKYIHYKTKPNPVCKICQIKDKPCIRCGKPVVHFGRITKNGAVCASCNRYFTEPKECRSCGKMSQEVWMRSTDAYPEPTPLCNACYNKSFPICTKCQRHSKTCLPDEGGKPVCKPCRGAPRICRQCGKPFPAGRGRICFDCSFANGLREKVAFAKGALSPMMAEHFESFSRYLTDKRGAEFATHRILYFFGFFQEIDAFIGQKERFPFFEQLVNHFTVAYTRKYLSAMQFFESAGLIERSPEIQELYANFDMIERYLDTFPKGESFHGIIQDYYRYLDEKQMAGKIGARTVRLSLTPAVKFLQYCRLFSEPEPTQTILDGYLWCIPGQRNTLSGFISFYNKTYQSSLVLSTSKTIPRTIRLKSPNKSKRRREQLFIRMMRVLNRGEDIHHEYTGEKILRIAIEYLHDVAVPDGGVMLSFLPVKQREGEHFIRFAGREFYLPPAVTEHLSCKSHEKIRDLIFPIRSQKRYTTETRSSAAEKIK